MQEACRYRRAKDSNTRSRSVREKREIHAHTAARLGKSRNDRFTSKRGRFAMKRSVCKRKAGERKKEKAKKGTA